MAMIPQVYGYPVLPQAGLGNMLIPWADCMLWCKDNEVPMISPSWTKFRLGPFVRREQDKRFYQRFFETSGQIAGLRRLSLLSVTPQVGAEQWRSIQPSLTNGRPVIVRFTSMDMFENLIGRADEVRLALAQMTKPLFHPPQSFGDSPFIGIHVRLRDYPPMTESGPITSRLPLEWYCRCLQEIRRSLGRTLPAIVFSDGSDAELDPLLTLPAVSRSPFRDAITDLLALAESTVVIASRSTFSLWGVYLSQAPSVWFPPKKAICRETILSDSDAPELEIEWTLDEPFPPGFALGVQERLRQQEIRSQQI